MAGIYIHIPFCKQACHYCNFHFSTSTSLKDDIVQALQKEIGLSVDHNYAKGQVINTIYFGGGTPSLLNKRELKDLLSAIKNSYPVSPSAEITLEANPDDITSITLKDWKETGVNRLSIGIQSFKDADLKWMNRAHNAADATACIQMARDVGFHNFSIDLIYGTPGLTDDEWHWNIKKIMDLQVSHVACYALTVEPGTALQKMINLRKKEAVSNDDEARQFRLLMKWMHTAGYEHYEISNFAKPGFRSRHNSSYWKDEPYVGIGPSAHSYNGGARKWNIANNALYIQSIKNDVIPFEEEILTAHQKLNEYIMTSLRTIEGFDLTYVSDKFSQDEVERINNVAKKYIDQGLMIKPGTKLILTDEGKLFADGIAADLFTTSDNVKL